MANSNFIQEAIFKAVDVILEKRLKSLQVNYCILGIIHNGPFTDSDSGDLYYEVNYQDMIIRAYPVTSGTSFKTEGQEDNKDNTLEIYDNGQTIDLINRNIVGTPTYKKGDLVYTLVINGDLSKKRIILCKA